MRPLSNTTVAPRPLAVEGLPWLDIDALLNLLAAVAASVDSDKATARACLRRAEELLGSCRNPGQRLSQHRYAARGGLAPWRKIRVTAYIETNLGSRITVTDLARIVGLSTGHFFRTFRASFGEPPLAYVARERIRRSQQLILSSGASLAQIAIDCGMSDQPHFTRVFRKIVGVNPSAWRREFAAKAVSTETRVAR